MSNLFQNHDLNIDKMWEIILDLDTYSCSKKFLNWVKFEFLGIKHFSINTHNQTRIKAGKEGYSLASDTYFI